MSRARTRARARIIVDGVGVDRECAIREPGSNDSNNSDRRQLSNGRGDRNSGQIGSSNSDRNGGQ